NPAQTFYLRFFSRRQTWVSRSGEVCRPGRTIQGLYDRAHRTDWLHRVSADNGRRQDRVRRRALPEPLKAAYRAHQAIPPDCSPGPGIRIVSWIGAGMQHTGFRIDDDHRHFAHRPRTIHSQLVPFGDQRLLHFLADTRLDPEVTRVHRVREWRRRETARRPAWGFDCLLDVHTEIDHVQKGLNCAHQLIVSAGTSHQSVGLAILHDERGCQCAAWTFAWGEGVGLSRN